MKVSFRLSDEDREKYGGDEWVHFDDSKLADLGYDKLAELERDIRRDDDTTITRIMAFEWPRYTMLGIRGMAWLALRLSGANKPAWTEFKPDILALTFELDKAVDADPPAGGSSEPPSAKTRPAKRARSKKA